ncbi:MAG: NusG domain II-containing protein [Eubacteriales bacterium]|nr:NusG domain II-containing protein [Eubacteriales bacterium]
MRQKGKSPALPGLRRGDLLLVLLIAAAALLFFLPGHFAKPPVEAVIEQDGKELMRLSLAQERTERINGVLGENIVQVADGSVSVTWADCPDQLCVRQGRISSAGQSIVCLPHRLVIYLDDGDGKGGLDAVAG